METEVKKEISAEEYEKLSEGPPQQLIKGEIIMTPSPTPMHQNISIELAVLLRNYVKNNNLGYILTAPLDVFLTEKDVFQPDIIFISNDKKEMIKNKIKGAPELVVEILSPSNAYYDLSHKKNIYEETGVKEFWVVDPVEKTVEIFENVNGTFITISKAKTKGVINSKILPGLKVEIEKLFVKI